MEKSRLIKWGFQRFLGYIPAGQAGARKDDRSDHVFVSYTLT